MANGAHHDGRPGRGAARLGAGGARLSRHRRGACRMIGYFLEQTGNALSLGGIYALLALGLGGRLFDPRPHQLRPWRADDPDRLCAGRRRRLLACRSWSLRRSPSLVVMASAVLLERIAFRPVRGASGATMLLTSFAVAVLLQLAFQLFISTRPQIVPLPAHADRDARLRRLRHRRQPRDLGGGRRRRADRAEPVPAAARSSASPCGPRRRIST